MFPGKAHISQHPEFLLTSSPPDTSACLRPFSAALFSQSSVLPPHSHSRQLLKLVILSQLQTSPSLIMQSHSGGILLSVLRGHHSNSSWPYKAVPWRRSGKSVSHPSSRFCHSCCTLWLTISCKALLGECCKKKSLSLIDLDKHVSVNTSPIPSQIIGCVSSSLLQGKAMEPSPQLHGVDLSTEWIRTEWIFL